MYSESKQLLIETVVLLTVLLSCSESISRDMENPGTKTVLVNVGDNTRVVTFPTSSESLDSEALAVAIKATFSDILLPRQAFLLQIKCKEWSHKAVVRAIVQTLVCILNSKLKNTSAYF